MVYNETYEKLSYLQQEGELWNTNILVISQIDITDTQNFTHLEILEQKKLQIEFYCADHCYL